MSSNESGLPAGGAPRGHNRYSSVHIEEFDDVTTLLDDPSADPFPGGRPGILKRLRNALSGFEPLHESTPLSDDAETGPLRNCPEERAGWLSKLLFFHVNPMMRLGAQKHLEPEDLPEVASYNRAGLVADDFERHLNATREMVHAPQGRVFRAAWRAYGRDFVLAGILKVLHDGVMFMGPYMLERLLLTLEDGGSRWAGLGWTLGLLAIGLLEALSINQYFYMLFTISLHTKTAMIHTLYRKSLRIASGVKTDMGTGAILNLQSNDAAKLWSAPQYLHMLWSAPLQIVIIMALLVRTMGWGPSFAGMSVTIFLIPVNTIVSKRLAAIRRQLVKNTDARVKLVTEVVTGIKAIKLYAWEEAYVERINRLRRTEMASIRRAAYLGIVNLVFFMSGPVLVAMAAFGTYTALGNQLTAPIAFPALALFNLLRFPIIMLPMQIMNIINGKVALRRIQNFMNAEEMEQTPPSAPARPGRPAVSIDGASFSWETGSEPTLRDIRLSVPAGELLIVVGEVGSGKSSLLSAILGEMNRRGGAVSVAGSVAYTAQDPWIRNATLKENVLMGEAHTDKWYHQVIEAACLGPDIAMLAAGDATEIGEKGINLSGGQKHRTALARAAATGADVYLLDDPLSAVDAHVGAHLFHRCVCGLLAGKTRILVTHQLQFLQHADRIAVLAGGVITHHGTYDELTAAGVDFAQYVAPQEGRDSESEGDPDVEDMGVVGPEAAPPAIVFADDAEADTEATTSRSSGESAGAAKRSLSLDGPPKRSLSLDGAAKPRLPPSQEPQGRLVKSEERAKGSVKRTIYMSYLRAWGPGLAVPALVAVFGLMERGLQVSQNVVLSFWSAHTSEAQAAGADPATSRYLALYFGLGLSSLVFLVIRAVCNIRGTTTAALRLYSNLQDKIIRLPMSFFDTQPTGRLLNRFTKDTEAVDTSLSQAISSFVSTASSVSLSLLVVLVVSPGVIAAVIPMFFLYRSVQRYYIATSRELKRLDSLAFSPIFGHFGETLSGLQTVRAFRKQMHFAARNEALIDASNRAYWPTTLVNRWLSLRLELMGNIIIFSTAFFIVVVLRVSAGLAGLAVTSALNFTGIMNWMVRQTSEMEVNMNSVERLLEYDSEPTEAAPVVPGHRPPSQWPTAGAITVKGLVVRYRPELDPVLKGISFRVEGQEKVGVCGRTGCGKSTLMMTLYRLVEPSAGSIAIDGLDVLGMGLRDLRSRLSLVPQDPVIFSGTVRSNLDPFEEAASDAAIWDALRQASLVVYVQQLDGGLDGAITEGGGNLSVGQRQLLCMARALLRHTKILILDEATSNVDNTTDSAIQTTVRSGFKNCTVLTIAHRLHTIIDSDRIMLLEAGELLEYDAPGKLLEIPGSHFSRLVAEARRGRE